MKHIHAIFLIVILASSGACKEGVIMNKFTLTSTAFNEGEVIPSQYTCEGSDGSPLLKWKGVPEGTKGYALTCLDPDAPPGTWVHWVIYDLPSNLTELAENVQKMDTLDNGAKQGLCWGVDSFTRVGYYGPCPPPGHGYHRYYFTLYALDVESVGLSPKATQKDLEAAMEGHILGEATVMGRYKRE